MKLHTHKKGSDYFNRWVDILTKNELDIYISTSEENKMFSFYLDEYLRSKSNKNVFIRATNALYGQRSDTINVHEIKRKDLFLTAFPFDDTCLQELTFAATVGTPIVCLGFPNDYKNRPVILKNNCFVDSVCSGFRYCFDENFGKPKDFNSYDQRLMDIQKYILRATANTVEDHLYFEHPIYGGFTIPTPDVLNALFTRFDIKQSLYSEPTYNNID